MNNRESLAEIVEAFKSGLMARATGGHIDPDAYVQGRKTIVGSPRLAALVPSFVTACRSPDEFWTFIKNEFDNYHQRRVFLAAELNPLIEALEQGETTAGAEFELGERLGAGGFGTVYRARHRFLEMDFAIKIFEPAFDDGNPQDLDRFFREVRVLFALRHSNIIRIHDAGLLHGKPFIRMECFEGKDLNAYLSRRGVLSSKKASVLVTRIASAMSHAHAEGVLHRDIKPSNVMLAAREDVRVVDFGLGMFVEAELVSRITKTGQQAVGGHYTAPELVEDPRLLDPSCDVYSIGAVWFTALTGRPPAGADLAERIDELGIQDRQAAILRRALSSRADRYSDASAMFEDLTDGVPEERLS